MTLDRAALQALAATLAAAALDGLKYDRADFAIKSAGGHTVANTGRIEGAAMVKIINAAPQLLAMAMRALELEAALDGINLQCICHLTTPQMCAGCVARAALAKGRQP